ncbi:laminarinase [Dendrothele bispora CBS 962.96]|uniref:Laminarinase n=1 Tax=Dendrothele bispora (strain CBS 962.96) TaxID=1314807 RepID=A0A4S8MRV0_DENBC|nr:laminarinase [Dendrothele bispora CBS 962.96]
MTSGISVRRLSTFLLLIPAVFGATYNVVDSFIGPDFLNKFSLQAIADPTHGRVNYVDTATATAQNLTFASADHFVARADSTTVLSASGPGRNSFRLQSNSLYGNGVQIFNINHMPEGCGTWPAVWSYAEPWPTPGEIDIVEGVNNQAPNQAALHTTPGCSMPASRDMTGTPTANDCDTSVNGNSGCTVQFTSSLRSFGPAFNANGGGWFAVERTSTFIKIWFWERSDSNVPVDVRGGNSNVDTDNWGTPIALFPNTSCNIASHFSSHHIIINLTFCGDWAGSVYPGTSGCPSTCVDFVNNNPAAFANAYFDFSFIKVYA